MTSKPMQLDILRTIYTLQNMHGLRNDDYTHYRRYLTRRLNRLYQKLNLTHGKNKYQARAITIEHVSQGDARYLLLLLLTIERAWAYGQARLSESTQNSAIRSSVTHHARCRFRKCEAHCKVVEDLVLPRARTVPNGSLQVLDEQTRHELTAYLHDIRGRCALGQKQFGKALECFVQAHTAYAGLCPPQPGGNILNNLEGSENEAATHKEVAVTSDWTHWVIPIMQQLEEAMIYTHHQLNNQERVSTSLSAGGVSSVLSSYPITPVSALFRSERSHLGPQELCWANMPIRVTATRILTMLKDLHTQEESAQDLVTHLPFRGSSAKILSKLRKVTEAYDRVFATCDELLEVVRNGAPIVHDADEDMNLQLLRQYVTFRMLVCRIRRGRTYIQVYFQIYLAQKGFITKEEVNSITLPARNALSCVMSKSSKTITAQDMAHLFAALAEHTREVRRLPGLLEEQERQYEAIHTYARAGSLLFKGVAWALQPHNSTGGTFGCSTKAYACLIHAERLAQQCIKCDVAVPHEWEDDVHILHTQIVREQALFKANEALQQVKAAATACDGIESIHVTKNESSRASKRPRIAASDLPPHQIHHNVGRLSSLEPRRELLLPKPCFYDIALSYIEEDVVPIDALEESLTQVASSGKVQKRSNDATLNSKNQKGGWFSNWFGSS